MIIGKPKKIKPSNNDNKMKVSFIDDKSKPKESINLQKVLHT